MYGKLFASMYDGTLYGNWEALVTFQQMIILCDKEGFIDMTPQSIAARTSIPPDIITKGIAVLEQPDQYSRTADFDGRRIERVDERRPWGWRIINYVKYRDMVRMEEKRQADRERIASKRAAERDGSRQAGAEVDKSATCRDVSQSVANVAEVEVEVEVEVEADKTPRPRSKARTSVPEFHQQVIAAYHELLSDLPRVKGWSARRRQALDARICERRAEGKPADTIEYWRALFQTVAASDWLTGRVSDFRADLEWLLRPENFLKVIEGRYLRHQAANGARAHA